MADNPKNVEQLLTPEQLLDKARKGEIPVEYTDKYPTTFTDENFKKFGAGQITWGELQGLSLQEAYAAADLAYTLFEQGRYAETQVLFEWLVTCNPQDPYFHTMLGAVYGKMKRVDEAIEEYRVAISLDPKNISAYVNRGELQLQKGNVDKAIDDLKSAIQLDPNSENPSSARARALAAATAAIAAKVLDKKS